MKYLHRPLAYHSQKKTNDASETISDLQRPKRSTMYSLERVKQALRRDSK